MAWLTLSLLLLGSLAGFTHLETRRLETRFPPVGDFAQVDGARLHVAELVRLPGIGHGLHHVATGHVTALIDIVTRPAAQ